MIYSEAYPSPIWCNDDSKDDKIHELWCPSWYNKVGAPGTMYNRFVFLAGFLLGSFFEIDTPGTINALLVFFYHFHSSNIVCWLHSPTGKKYVFWLSSSYVTVVPIMYNYVSQNSKASLIQPGSNKTSFFAYVLSRFFLPLLPVMGYIWCIFCLTLFFNICYLSAILFFLTGPEPCLVYVWDS